MTDFLEASVFFGLFLSLLSYGAGVYLKRKFKLSIFNPLLISIILTILVLVIFRVDYEVYYDGAKYISYLLTPATVCLAIPLYRQLELLKQHATAILLGVCSGVVASMGGIFVIAALFHLSHEEYVTFLPKSITTAIGMGVSEELGGIVTITVAIIILTGIIGNVIASTVCKVFRIEEPIAKGLAIGTAAHAIGTARALEMGPIEGAMSSLAVAVAGILTAFTASLFAMLL